MNNFDAIIDFGSRNLRISIFDQASKNIYSSNQTIIDSSDKSLNILIRDAEKNLSTHIDNIVVLYDSPKYYSLDISIRKDFDYAVSIRNVYNSLIEEANYIVSQNNFKDQTVHLVVNNIIIDEYKKLNKIIDDIKIKSMILEIKFICLNKILINSVSKIFKKNNLNITNLYCASYVKAFNYRKKFEDINFIVFLDIGFERTSALFFNKSKFEFYKSIPFGGNSISKDISKILKLDLDYSEDLKMNFNKEENNMFLNKSDIDQSNPYIEFFEKNISIDLLKQVIESRIEEIIELTVYKNNYLKNSNFTEKPKLIFTGSGSQLLMNFNNLKKNKFSSETTIFDENDLKICAAGLHYHKSDERYLSQTKKKLKKQGFFENFFNLFSK